MNGRAGAETPRLRIERWNLLRDDEAGRERWLVADDDGEVCGRIEFERHRAFAYAGDGPDAVIDVEVSSVSGARSRTDGFGATDDESRKAVLVNIMLLLPAYLPA